MSIGIIIGIVLLIYIWAAFGYKTILYLVAGALLGWWLCNIDAAKEYTWYSGILHGFLLVPNLFCSLFTEKPIIAESHTTAYMVFLCIFGFISFIEFRTICYINCKEWMRKYLRFWDEYKSS